jgi:hypothetical protein
MVVPVMPLNGRVFTPTAVELDERRATVESAIVNVTVTAVGGACASEALLGISRLMPVVTAPALIFGAVIVTGICCEVMSDGVLNPPGVTSARVAVPPPPVVSGWNDPVDWDVSPALKTNGVPERVPIAALEFVILTLTELMPGFR